ncbi:hypothetical protein FGG08_003709 [Glutinoglossum americanum]|uniref:Uncharacterized protein n=1 Tax=Glutinoglossum americanum TaxID=1670608 RepID=A0A9P8L3E0_9PEZI|nr:hypothetical protein FGG08_003709 [Glutinoglossum americanum]
MAPRSFPLTNTTGDAQGVGIVTTITGAPNYDFGFLSPNIGSWVLQNQYYSIDWAHVRVANSSLVFQGAPPQQTGWNKNGSCITWWDLPEEMGSQSGGSAQVEWATIVVDAPEPSFCTPHSTLASYVYAKLKRNALSEWLDAREISLQARDASGSGAPNPVTKTKVSYKPQPDGGQQPIYPNDKDPAKPEPLPTVNFDDPPTPPSPAQTPVNPIPAPSGQQQQQPPDQAVDSAVAKAIDSLFSGTKPNDPPPNGNPGNSQPIGAIIASAFGSLPSGNGNSGNGAPPSQGQINGVPYSVGSGGIVVGGSTYNPSNPTVIALPDGHTANIGPGGLSIDNGPIVPIVGGGSPTQGQVNGVPYSMAPGGIVISGTTFSVSQPTSVTLPGGQTMVIGPNGLVQIGGVTIPGLAGSSTWSGSVDGINYQINPDGTIVVNGQTLNLAQPTSITLPGGKVVTIGPNGINFGGTLIPFPSGLAFAMPTAMTIAGIPFSIGAGEVVIGGKTYSFPPGATGTTIVIDGKTISIGPNGIGFPSTTVPLTRSVTTTGASTTATSSGSTTTTTTTTSHTTSGTSTAPTPAKTTTKKGSAAGLKELLGSVLALELLAIFAISLL